MSGVPSSELLRELHDIVGPRGWVDDEEALRPHLTEWRGRFSGQTPAMVCPADVEQTAAIVRICAEAGVGMVPQGGNTGLCGGAVPDQSGRQILLSTSRLNRIRDTNPLDYTITAESGCLLADLQAAADDVDRLFALSLAAEGSCHLGGNISTDAGGTNTLRYGTARDQVLGLEVVLADGRVWHGLRALRKDTAGYDLKQLFIGAEGTLGIITAAVCKLFPKPRGTATAFVALRDPEAALETLAAAREFSGDTVTALELLPRIGLEFVLRHIPGTADPLDSSHEWYALLEVSSARSPEAAMVDLEQVLSAVHAAGSAVDAVVAVNVAQSASFWRLRDAMSEAQKHEGGSIKHDIAVPVSSVPRFIAAATRAVTEVLPGIRVVAFGHIGDGNIHFNLSQPVGADRRAFLDHWGRFNRLVHDLAVDFGGTVSAEHGIGQLKVEELERCRGGAELTLMAGVKKVLDPGNIMNPGKVLRMVE